jgi:hypothetical protein
MAVDGGTEYAGLRTTTNDLRLITGLAAGYAISMLLVPMLNDSVWTHADEGRVLDPAWRIGVWLATLPLVYAAVWYGGPMLGVAYPVLVAVAILFTLTCVNMVFVSLTPWFDRKARRLLDVWPGALAGLVLTLGEAWLAGLLRAALVALATRIS